MERQNTVASLMVMVTYACELDCPYCEVVKTARHMDPSVLRRAVDLLMTSPSPVVQLRFFGGEPLLRFDLILQGIAYGEKQALALGKKIKFMITTNGHLLDEEKIRQLSGHGVEIMFSFDGSAETHRRFRPAKDGEDIHPILLKNLEALERSDIPYFINAVVEPANMEHAAADIAFMANRGFRRVQVCYRCAVEWKPDERRSLLDLYRRLMRDYPASGPQGTEILNVTSDCEPTMLSDEILVDVDGEIYLDIVVFMERTFPRLRPVMRLGRLGEVKGIEELSRSQRQIFELYRETYPAETPAGRIFINNVHLGMELRRLFLENERGAVAAGGRRG